MKRPQNGCEPIRKFKAIVNKKTKPELIERDAQSATQLIRILKKEGYHVVFNDIGVSDVNYPHFHQKALKKCGLMDEKEQPEFIPIWKQ